MSDFYADFSDFDLSSQGLNGGDVDFEASWQVLEKAFVEIHTKNASALSFEELYRSAYKIVLKKEGDELYRRVVQFEQKWLAETVRARLVKRLQGPARFDDNVSLSLTSASERKRAGENFLQELKDAWDDHQVCMGMLTDVLMYMVSACCWWDNTGSSEY